MKHGAASGGLTLVVGLACARGGPLASEPPRTPIESGPGARGDATLVLAVYLPAADPSAARSWADAVAAGWPELPIGPAEGRGVAFYTPPIADFAPLDQDQLQRFGKGFDEVSGRAFGASQGVVVSEWVVPAAEARRAMHLADTTSLGLARSRGGWVWDEVSRLAYTPEAWEDERLVRGWVGEVPVVPMHVAQHLYDDGAGLRLVTLGMQQLALPDLEVRGLLPRHGSLVGTTVEAVEQALGEGREVGTGGALEVSFRELRDPRWTERAQVATERGGDAVLRVRLVEGVLDEGDADNRVWAIDLRGSGDERFRPLRETWGEILPEQEIERVRDPDPELLAAAVRARAELRALRADGRALALGTHLTVKAPFQTAGGSVEWMWVAVKRWEGDTLSGLLHNEPQDVPSLHLGSAVEVGFDEVADYTWVDVDGHVVGGLSVEILRRRGP